MYQEEPQLIELKPRRPEVTPLPWWQNVLIGAWLTVAIVALPALIWLLS